MKIALREALLSARSQQRVTDILCDALYSDEGCLQVLDLLDAGRIDADRFMPDDGGAWLNVLQAFAWVHRRSNALTPVQLDFPLKLRQIGVPFVSRDTRGLPVGHIDSPLQILLKAQCYLMRPYAELIKVYIRAGDSFTPGALGTSLHRGPSGFDQSEPDWLAVLVEAQQQADACRLRGNASLAAIWTVLINALTPQSTRQPERTAVWVM